MRYIVASIILAVSFSAIAEPFVDQKLSPTRTALLGNHLQLALPVDMEIAPRRAGIMSAENSAEDETRAVLDVKNARFVMMSQELYALAGTDAKASIEAAKTASGFKGTLEPLSLPKPLVGFAIAPVVSTDREANLTYAAWIVNGDGTVQSLAFYVNPEGATQGSKWTELGKKIVASLAPGSRVLGTNAGERVLGDLAIKVPDGWVVSAQPGPDFDVFHLRKVVVLGQTAPSCGVYVGDHPSPQHAQEDSKAAITASAGKVLGSKAEWSSWASEGGWSTETMVRRPWSLQTVHVFCSAASEAELPGLRAMAESLHVK